MRIEGSTVDERKIENSTRCSNEMKTAQYQPGREYPKVSTNANRGNCNYFRRAVLTLA